VTTAAELLLARADDDRPALLFEDRSWSYRQLVDEGLRRAALHEPFQLESREDGRPLHVGVLLDNTPEYVFWLTAAALSGAVVVGINSTYRGEALGQLISHTDCDLVVTSTGHLSLLDGIDDVVPQDRMLVVDGPRYGAEVDRIEPAQLSGSLVTEDDLFLLIFTSGSTGLPKAVRCTQGRFARTGAHVANLTQVAPGNDVVYCPLPFFHSASLFSGWAGALTAAVPIATRSRFSASGTVPDLRRHGATVLTYTGKVLNYILSVPESRHDADSRLRLALGNEASLSDIKEFARRFDCTVRDSYGSTEGMIIIRRDPSMPDGALGSAAETVKIVDPETLDECPAVRVGADGQLVNLEQAVGEIVETAPTTGFEGYYKNPVATTTRFRNGWYWSGDLGYRDDDGWFYFAGRSNEWLRVDGENFAAAPVEVIVARHPSVRSVAVYAVPDDPVGDRVMAALELHQGSSFDPEVFDVFLADQPDLGPKWLPAFVRTTDELPKLASMKIDKTTLRQEAWTAGEVYWRPAKGEGLRLLGPADRERLDPLLKRATG
jgi:fatty-acyl-CoA synthase